MIAAVENYCYKILTTTKCNQLAFHNLEHTLEVVENIQIIGENLGLSEDELEPIKIAGWFHDVGFCERYIGHEDVSINMAKIFLLKEKYNFDKIDVVVSCISATKMPQVPTNKYAEVISDADIFHLGTDTFFYRKLLLRREWEIELNKTSTDLEWHLLNLDFLRRHKYFTSYGKSELMAGQYKNEERVKNLIKLYS